MAMKNNVHISQYLAGQTHHGGLDVEMGQLDRLGLVPAPVHVRCVLFTHLFTFYLLLNIYQEKEWALHNLRLLGFLNFTVHHMNNRD